MRGRLPTWNGKIERSKPKRRRESVRGCMPAIFSFLHRYRQPRSPRCLPSTSGKKTKFGAVAPPTPPEPIPERPPQPSPPQLSSGEKGDAAPTCGGRRRCPVVARLMGLEELPAPETSQPDSAAEMRRKLLRELQRCEQDLVALRVVVEALQVAAEVRRTAADAVGGPPHEVAPAVHDERKSDASGRGGHTKKNGGITFAKRAMAAEGRPRFCERSMTKGREGEERLRWRTSRSSRWLECVEEVCDEYLVGERWECRKIVVSLERGIFGDLMVEAVREMEDQQHVDDCRSCRRRLCF